MPSELLRARRDALEQLREDLIDDDYDIAERAIDTFLDYVEYHYDKIETL